MRTLGLSLALIAIGGFARIAFAPMPSAPRPAACDESAMPSHLREVLKNRFAGWRPKRLSDLDTDAQKLWVEGQNGKACPGIAIGYFESARQTSYALLLVPESEPTHGYKVVLFSVKSRAKKFTFQNLWKTLTGRPTSPVSLVHVEGRSWNVYRPGEGEEHAAELDGVVVEWLEKAAVLYYWFDGRYQRISISD